MMVAARYRIDHTPYLHLPSSPPVPTPPRLKVFGSSQASRPPRPVPRVHSFIATSDVENTGLGGFALHDIAAELFLGVYDASSTFDLSPLTSPTQVHRFYVSDNNTFHDEWDPVHSRVRSVVAMFDDPLDQTLRDCT